MKLKILFCSLAIAIGLGVTASAQSDSKLKVPTTTPKQDAGNPAKLPPTVKQLFIPDLRLKGAESVAVDATVPKSYFKVVFTFQNWSDFPPEMLQPATRPPSLPPDPCTQTKTSDRLFAVLLTENTQILGCTALKPNEDFFFLLPKDKQLPNYVYAIVRDRQTGKKYKSHLISPSSGVMK